MFSAPATAAPAKTLRLVSPTKGTHDYDARIAVIGPRLYLATIGTNAWGDYRILVHRYDGHGWARLPGMLPTAYDDGLELGVLSRDGEDVPCVGDSPREGARIRCLTDGSWKTISTPELKGFAVTGLRADGSDLTASFARWNEDGTTTVRVGVVDGASVALTDPPLQRPGAVLANLGETAGGDQGTIDVGLQQYSDPGSGRRSVATMTGGEWTISPALPVVHGAPPISGPVRSGDALYLTTPSTRPWPRSPIADWPLSTFRLDGGAWSRATGRILTHGRGANQGGTFAIGDRVWTVWSREYLTRRKAFRASMFAVRFSPDGTRIDRRFTVARRYVPAAPIMQATSYRGRPAFLYGTSNRRGHWRAVVEIAPR
ncbi:MAG: hypothetical protein J0H98_03645 [Solirubrobacterales bacterium]|nr:hypothetical protein [Solirubrobacterales bacterium]